LIETRTHSAMPVAQMQRHPSAKTSSICDDGSKVSQQPGMLSKSSLVPSVTDRPSNSALTWRTNTPMLLSVRDASVDQESIASRVHHIQPMRDPDQSLIEARIDSSMPVTRMLSLSTVTLSTCNTTVALASAEARKQSLDRNISRLSVISARSSVSASKLEMRTPLSTVPSSPLDAVTHRRVCDVTMHSSVQNAVSTSANINASALSGDREGAASRHHIVRPLYDPDKSLSENRIHSAMPVPQMQPPFSTTALSLRDDISKVSQQPGILSEPSLGPAAMD
jgi:hypothetical protein